MSSPNDPANGDGPWPTTAPTTSGHAPTTGGVTDRGETPPWQHGKATRAQQPRQEPRPETRPEPRLETPPLTRPDPPRQSNSTTQSIDDRINRFMSGSSAGPTAAAAPSPPKTPDTEGTPARPEAYRSELPDLSDPVPRPRARRRAPAERPSIEPAGTPNTPAPAAPSGSGARVQVGARPRGPVRASMQIRRVDPWTVLKVSLVLSIALFFVWMIAVAFLYLVLGAMGVWSKLNSNVGDLLTNTSNAELVSSGAIFGGATLIGLVNIVLLTAMATVGAFIYNLTTDLVGGVEVTLADRD